MSNLLFETVVFENILRRASIAHGLTADPLLCGCGGSSPNVFGKAPAVEEDEAVAAKPFQWPGLERIEKRFFAETLESITDMEGAILKALRLPSLGEVRQAELADEEEGGKPFERFTSEMSSKIDKAVEEFLGVMLGAAYANAKSGARASGIPIYEFYTLAAMKYGVDRTAELLKEQKGRPEIISGIAPDPKLLRFRAMQSAAGERIRTELALKRLPELKRELERMAISGEGSLKVARRIHRDLGEGSAWYWKRITRTESTLANNLAFDLMAEENGVLYEQWQAGPDACIICLGFDSRVWRRGDGPSPAADTHPHCGCVRIGLYSGAGTIQERWTRPSPYDQPYTRAEIAAIEERLRGGRGVGYRDLAQDLNIERRESDAARRERVLRRQLNEAERELRSRQREQEARRRAEEMERARAEREALRKRKEYEKERDRIVRGWVRGSKNAASMHAKQAVLEEFNLSGVVFGRRPIAIDPELVGKWRPVTRQIYEETQSYFREQGITEVVLYRGIKKEYSVKGVLESWSDDIATAKKFNGRHVWEEHIPVERVFISYGAPGWKNGPYGMQYEYILLNEVPK